MRWLPTLTQSFSVVLFMGKFFFGLLMLSQPIVITIVGIILLVFAIKLLRNPRNKKVWLSFAVSFPVCLMLLMLIVPNDVRYKITEIRLGPALETGKPVAEIRNYLEDRNIKYTYYDKEKCSEKGMSLGIGSCRKIPNVYIVFPVIFSIIDGHIRTTLYFDDRNQLESYEMKASWDFI